MLFWSGLDKIFGSQHFDTNQKPLVLQISKRMQTQHQWWTKIYQSQNFGTFTRQLAALEPLAALKSLKRLYEQIFFFYIGL